LRLVLPLRRLLPPAALRQVPRRAVLRPPPPLLEPRQPSLRLLETLPTKRLRRIQQADVRLAVPIQPAVVPAPDRRLRRILPRARRNRLQCTLPAIRQAAP